MRIKITKKNIRQKQWEWGYEDKLRYKSMVKIIAVCMMIIMSSGCSLSKDDKEVNKDANTVIGNNNELRGKLTVTTMYDGYIDIFAEEFMDMHPDVEITVIRPEEENIYTYMNQVTVELLGGTASDLIDLSKLNINNKAKSGLLVNLYELMDNDPDFDKSDYYTNIFEAMEYEGGLYAMPFLFHYDMVYMSKPLAESVDLHYADYRDINYIEMMDIYEKVKKTHPSPDEFYLMPAVVKESFCKDETIEFYNIETGEIKFDSDEFLQFLELTKTLNTTYHPERMDLTINRVGVGNEDFLIQDFMFCKFQSNAIDMNNMMIEFQNTIGPIPFLNSKGNAPFNNLFSTYAISQNCENKRLAWEFLKYCVSAKELPVFKDKEDELRYAMMHQGWIPINIENFYTSFRYNFEFDIKSYEDGGSEVEWKFKNEEEKEQMIQDTLNQIHEWNKQRNISTRDWELMELLEEELNNYYYYDLATAEETIKIIQNKVFTYLNE